MELQDVLSKMLNNFSAATRRAALREIARYLLLSNRKRIRANVQPDGSAMQARKDGAGRMFRKIGRQMQQRATADQAEVGFAGRTGWVATNHQLGRSIRQGKYTVNFPVRELLGLDEADRKAVRDILIKYVGVGWAA